MTPTVLQLISTGGFYGAERVVLELSAYLQSRGWGVRIGLMESPGADVMHERSSAAGVACDRLPGTLINPLRTRKALRDWVSKHNATLVHAHGYKTDVLAWWALRQSGIPLTATCHSWYSDSLKLKFYEQMDKWALRRMQGVVAVSGSILNDLRASGVPPERTRIITNGIASPLASGRSREEVFAEIGVPAGANLIVRIGRLDKNKGNHHLLDAMAGEDLGNNHWLLLVGEGPEREALADQARKLGLENRVLIPGYRGDVADLLAAADVMVICSMKEGLPIVLLEAMACRTALVTTAVGMIPDLITDGDTGWVVTPGSAEALRRALAEALNHSEERRRRTEAAFALYERSYSREAMGAQYMKLYEEILNGQGGGDGNRQAG